MTGLKIAAGAMLCVVGVALLAPPVVGGIVALALPAVATGAVLLAGGILDVLGVQ